VHLDNVLARTVPTSLRTRANLPVHVGRSVHVLPGSALVKTVPTRLLRRGIPARKSTLFHVSCRVKLMRQLWRSLFMHTWSMHLLRELPQHDQDI
jgi:hypothetical protein